MSTNVIQNTNRLIDETRPIIDFLDTAKNSQVLYETEVDWAKNVVLKCESRLRDVLLAMKLAHQEENGQLTFKARGRAFLGKILLGLDEQLKEKLVIGNRYVLESLLAAGKNSLAYKAEDLRLGRLVVLKFFRPGRGGDIVKNIAKLGRVKGDPVLVNPLDLFQYDINGGHGRVVAIDVMVFPYIDGMTLREYLATERNSSPVVIQAFIEQTCIALRALQMAGLSHGDLHPNNVLVTTEPDGQAAFRIIDVSYGADQPSDYELPTNDFEGFKFILRLALEDVQSKLARISLRRHLGARIFTLVEYILKSEKVNFDEIYREIQSGDRFTAFSERKEAFLRKIFSTPHDFGILRYEELSDPNMAIKLFYPYPELFQRLSEFGSTTLFGHRGTGKSTYMAALNFFPQVKDPLVDFRKSFGVLFSCRQGEFRKFSNRNLKSTSETKLLIKDILITKIIRKTLSSLAAGVAKERLAPPKTVKVIADLLLPHVQQSSGIMISHQMSEVESLKATMLHAEINAIDRLFAGHPMPPQSRLLDEHSLVHFFEAVRAVFSELNQARFSVLFDDAGIPNVPNEVQSLICDLMASTNSIYCVKLSAEKKTFEFLTTDKKPIERVHDVRVYTISDYFSLGGGFSTERKHVEEYFRRLIGLRLNVCRYKSEDIREYLGVEVMKPDELVARLVSRNRGEPVYGGWQTVWQIADRTMRHLLEMISTIFDESKTTPDKTPSIISKHVQSRQILRFSRDKLRGLMFLPGTIDIEGKVYPLGKMLYEFAASFGKVSGYYLQSSSHSEVEHASKPRFDERLAIEIDNTLNLNTDAQRMLDQLIRFAVIDDEKMITAFDDRTRKPIYIFNKVYCPDLRISFRRYAHWRLSSKRFEQFLLHPTQFVRSDERLIKFLIPEAKNERGLFD
jgi:serine/threonine protein kinase